MKRLKIIADSKIPYLKGILEPYARISYYPPQEITADKVHDADILIIRTRTVATNNYSGTVVADS